LPIKRVFLSAMYGFHLSFSLRNFLAGYAHSVAFYLLSLVSAVDPWDMTVENLEKIRLVFLTQFGSPVSTKIVLVVVIN